MRKKKKRQKNQQERESESQAHSFFIGGWGKKKRGLFQTLVFIAYNQLDSGVCYLILLYDATSLGGLRIKMASSKAIYVWE